MIDGLIVLGIFCALGFVIYNRLAQKNHRIKEVVGGISLKFTEKIPFIPEKQDKVQQVYNEKRTMM